MTVTIVALHSRTVGEVRVEFTSKDRNEVIEAAERWRQGRLGYEARVGDIYKHKDRVWCCIGSRRASCD